MSLDNLQQVIDVIKSGNTDKILHWYSPRQLRKSQLIKLKANGITATCRKRANAWFEIDFVKI